MSDFNFTDSAIKLFGQTIPFRLINHGQFQSNDVSVALSQDTNSDQTLCSPSASLCEDNPTGSPQGHKKPSKRKLMDETQEDDCSHQTSEDLCDPTTSSGNANNPKTPSVDREASLLKSSKSGGKSEANKAEENTLKKPDKILPCPRCNSMDTKFCYYNNYNVKQPRHFCKKCQRYWTAGGTMRNVPVGAGRRKNKNSSMSQFRHLLVSEPLQAAVAHTENGGHNPAFGTNGTLLTFGSDSYICEPVTPGPRLADKSQHYVGCGIPKPEDIVSRVGGEHGDDNSTGSSVTASNSSEKENKMGLQELAVKNWQGFPPQVPCFPGPSWPYPWNSVQAVPPPAVCPAGYPVSFYPTPTYWGCTVPCSWNISYLTSSAASHSHCSPSSIFYNRTPEKSSKEGTIIDPVNAEKEKVVKVKNNSDRFVPIPKTLRIDDPAEAAKSSIRTTLEDKNPEAHKFYQWGWPLRQSTCDVENHAVETSPVLLANPAAFSRSFQFHESI